MILARLALVVLLALSASACVSFEVAPVETQGCDAALAGAWLPEDAGPDDAPAVVTADCGVTGLRGAKPDERQRFGTFEFDGHRYIAVQADDTETVADSAGKTIETWPATRVELYRYRLDGDRLLLWAADPGTARTLGSDGVTVHTDDTRDAATGKPVPRSIGGDVYLSGRREAIADALRRHGDALYRGMRPEYATTLHRTAPGDAAP